MEITHRETESRQFHFFTVIDSADIAKTNKETAKGSNSDFKT
jgi:hypothetical protein